jgi:electron transfer flavoprotein alpha subunit
MGQEILVVVEHQQGEIADVTFELLGKGRELASKTGGTLTAALFGSGVQAAAASLGAADKVVYVDHERLADFNPEACSAALVAVVGAREPWLTLVANSSMGMDLAAALSVRRDLPLVAYAIELALDGGNVVATSQLYGGKIYTESVLETGVVSVLAGSFPDDAGRVNGAPEVETFDAPDDVAAGSLRFTGLIEPKGGDVDITQTEVLVAVGRGIQSEDNLAMMEELAAKLGGAVCSSRPIVDNKWLPKTRQVGKSGLKVKPRIYLAFGISGAPEHIEGMKNAELIIAVNTDETAPIFEHADYGTTEDLFDIVPALTGMLE